MASPPARSSPLRVRFAEFELDEANARLLRNGMSVPLSPTPFGLLCALVDRAGSLLTKHALLDEVWGHRFVSDSVLKGTISDIRIALGDDARSPRFIETVARRGYRFIAVPTSLQTSEPRTRAPARHAASLAERSDAALAAPAGPPEARHETSFVGRATMLARLARAWERARAGTRVIVWIAGEPGIGKSALIEHFASSLGEGAYVRGQCVQQYGAGESYHPVLEAVAELCRRDASVPSLLRAVAPTWLLQLPWVSTAEEREALRRELAGASPERMLREMGEFLDRYTQDRSLLLVTEDLHWGDRPTLQLLDFLARRRSSARLMWVPTFRLAEVVATDHPLNELRHELLLHRLCEEIVLDSFSEADVAAYLAERWPAIAADESMVRALHERTEGVPLFIASMLSDIAARSAASGVSTAKLLASSPVPENLLAIIEHYSNRLSDERRVLLSAAAVCGAEFGIAVVAKVLERDAVEIAAECERLLRERLWLAAPRGTAQNDSDDERYSFRHALFRQVLYDRMGSSARIDMHRKVGGVLERERAEGRPISAVQLATHYDLGRSPLDALRYYAEAAEAALAHLHPGECLQLTERALSLLARAQPTPERAALEFTLATLRGVAAFHVLGVGDEARKAYLQARALLGDVGLHPLRGVLVQGIGQLLSLRAEYAEALATADRVDALAAEIGDPLLEIAALSTRGDVQMFLGRSREGRATLERALLAIDSTSASAEQFIGDPRPSTLAMLAIQLTHLGLVDQARERIRQAYACVDRLPQPLAALRTIWCDVLVQVRLGDTQRVAELATQMSALVEKHGLAQGRMATRWFRASAKARRESALEAFREIRAAYEENTALGMIAGASEVLGYAADALVLHGDFDGAGQQLEQALAIVERHGERYYLPQLLLTQAAVARGRGDAATADASMRRALEEARAQEAPWLELLSLTALCDRSAAKTDDQRALRAVVSKLSEGSDTPAYARARAVLDRARRRASRGEHGRP